MSVISDKEIHYVLLQWLICHFRSCQPPDFISFTRAYEYETNLFAFVKEQDKLIKKTTIPKIQARLGIQATSFE